MAFRSYEHFLLSQHVMANSNRTVGRLLSWSRECDVVLAGLVGICGYSNHSAISKHPVWSQLTQRQPGRMITVEGLLKSGSFRQNSHGIQGLAQLLLGIEISSLIAKRQ